MNCITATAASQVLQLGWLCPTRESGRLVCSMQRKARAVTSYSAACWSEQLHVRQIRPAHQELSDAAGGLPALADGPDDQALAAAHVAGGEDAGDAAHVLLVHFHFAAPVEPQPHLLDRARL